MEAQRRELAGQIQAKPLTPEQITDIKAFAQKVRLGLSTADERFEVKRKFIETLDIRAVCTVEEGQKNCLCRVPFGHRSFVY